VGPALLWTLVVWQEARHRDATVREMPARSSNDA
jgi:hypothetical protein